MAAPSILWLRLLLEDEPTHDQILGSDVSQHNPESSIWKTIFKIELIKGNHAIGEDEEKRAEEYPSEFRNSYPTLSVQGGQ